MNRAKSNERIDHSQERKNGGKRVHLARFTRPDKTHLPLPPLFRRFSRSSPTPFPPQHSICIQFNRSDVEPLPAEIRRVLPAVSNSGTNDPCSALVFTVVVVVVTWSSSYVIRVRNKRLEERSKEKGEGEREEIEKGRVGTRYRYSIKQQATGTGADSWSFLCPVLCIYYVTRYKRKH